MKILITGGAGFIGSQLGLYLDSKKYTVTLLDNLSSGFIHNFSKNIRLVNSFICMDIRSPELSDVMKNIDIVFHIAGFVSLPGCNNDPALAYSINVVGTANVLEMARRNNVKKVIFASTAALYENESRLPFDESADPKPTLIYAQTKKAAEDLCRSFTNMYKMDITILRFFNVYGPHMDYRPPSYLISYLIGCLIRKDTPVLHSNGKQARDFVYVEDVAKLCEIVMTHPRAKNKIFNVGSGAQISVQEIFDIIAEIFREKKIQPIYRSPKFIWEKFPRQFEGKYPIKPALLGREVNKVTLADISTARRLLNWQPKVSFRQGLLKTIAYSKRKFKNNET